MDRQLSTDQKILLRLTQILDANLGRENFGVKELAREIGLSKSQLLRKLQGLTNKSTSQFIREYRLQKGMALLQQEAGTASEIAYRVGFSSPSYFSTCFHEYYGYPPGEAKLRNGSDISATATEETNTPKKGHKKRILVFSMLGLLLVVGVAATRFLNSEPPQQTTSVVVPAQEKSIAVLPFKNLSGDSNFEYVSDGMTDAIISRLAKIRSIKNVIPFTTMLTYKETDKSAVQIAGELSVTHLLEGNVQRSGDTIKVVLRLIDGLADTYDWTDDFRGDWKSGAIFEMQARVAENVARKMGIQLSHHEVEVIKKSLTKNYEAYSNYLKAELSMMQMNKVGFDDAIQFYEKAIIKDSSFEDAYVGMSRVWRMQASFNYHDKNEAYKKANYYMDKAILLHPTDRALLNEYYFSLFLFDWDYPKLEKYYQTLIAKDSLFVSPEMTAYAFQIDRQSDAFRAIDMALAEDPKNLKMLLLKAWGLFWTGKNSEASYLLDEIMPLSNDLEWLKIKGALLLYNLGEYEHFKIIIESFNADNKFTSTPLGLVLTFLAQNEEQRLLGHDKLKKKLIALYDAKAGGSPAYFLALYLTTTKEYDEALEWLQNSYHHNEPELRWLYVQPCFKPLHQEPRFKELLDKIGFSKVIKL